MRLHQLSTQQLTERQAFQDWDSIFQYAVNACRPALKQTSNPIYRGMEIPQGPDRIIASGKRYGFDDLQREEYVHLCDQWMTEKFKYPYISQGIFTTGNKTLAGAYGELHIVLPIGQFEYVWSPKVEDQIDIEDEWGDGDQSPESLFSMLDNAGYTNGGLGQAVSTGHEVIIRCERYFHFSLPNVKEWGGNYQSLDQLWDDLRG